MTQKQRINELHSNERAVSPVIGVILMVAITVILAAVIGTFVLDLGQSVGDTGPTASVSFSDASDNYAADGTTYDAFVLEHQGGDELDLEDMDIVVRNESDNNIALSWSGSSGLSGSETGNWTVEYNGVDITSSANQTMESGDIIVLKLETGSAPPADDVDYKISFVDKDTDTTVGAATVQLK